MWRSNTLVSGQKRRYKKKRVLVRFAAKYCKTFIFSSIQQRSRHQLSLQDAAQEPRLGGRNAQLICSCGLHNCYGLPERIADVESAASTLITCPYLTHYADYPQGTIIRLLPSPSYSLRTPRLREQHFVHCARYFCHSAIAELRSYSYCMSGSRYLFFYLIPLYQPPTYSPPLGVHPSRHHRP